MATINAVRRHRNRPRSAPIYQVDYLLVLAIAGLLVVGMLMVFSTTFDYGLRFHDDSTYFMRRQVLGLIIGVVGAFFLMSMEYHNMRRWSVPLLLGTLGMLLFVLLFGDRIFGARRGLIEGSIQPSEVAKLVTILYIAHWLSSKGDRIKNLTYGLVPFSVITGVVCGLVILQPDLGTSGLIAIIAFTLFFIAGADLRQFGIAGLLGGVAFSILVTILPHAAARIESFKIALLQPTEAGWHIKQTVVALGSGGWLGVGLGQSEQKFGPLPAAHTDGVFAILGEELGFIGAMVVVALITLFAWRGFRAAALARDGYGFLLGVGITSWLTFQSLINMAVVTSVVPFTGMPFPFLSYGGSSMVISLFGVGVLLSISRDATLDIKVQHTKTIRESLRENLDLRRRNGRSYLSGRKHRQ